MINTDMLLISIYFCSFILAMLILVISSKIGPAIWQMVVLIALGVFVVAIRAFFK